MPSGLQTALLIAGTAATALSAGLLFAYSVSVNPGLAMLGDEAYLQAMQGINKAIQNGVFFLAFFSPLVLLPWLSWNAYREPGQPIMLLAIAAAIYIVGVIGITVFGNVPLNNALEVFNIKGASAEALKAQRTAFEGPWNRLHSIRTIAAIASLILLITALAKHPKPL